MMYHTRRPRKREAARIARDWASLERNYYLACLRRAEAELLALDALEHATANLEAPR